MMCYKVPKFIEIEGKMSVFELGNERLKIHSLSAIFFALIQGKKYEAWKGFASYRICGASYFAAMPQNASYADRRAS